MGLMQLVRDAFRKPEPAVPAPASPRQETTRPPVRMVVAPPVTDPAKMGWYLGKRPNADPTIVNHRSKASVGFKTDFGLLREIASKDGMVRGFITQRKSSVIKRDKFTQPDSDKPEALFAQNFINKALAKLDLYSAGSGGLANDMFQMLDAPHYGIYVGKIVWDWRTFRVDGLDAQRRKLGLEKVAGLGPDMGHWYIPIDLQQEELDRVGFDWEGRLIIRAQFRSEADAALQGFTPVPNESNWWYPHPGSYFVFSPYSYADNPYGTALLSTVFYTAWLKRQVRVWYANFIERNTSGLAEAYHPDNQASSTTEEIAAINDAIDNIQQEVGLVMPPGWRFAWHTLVNAEPAAIEAFLARCDQEAAAAIIGQTSTAIVDSKGNQSSAEVQERTADGIVTMDSLMLMGAMNQFIGMVLGYNLPQLKDDWPTWGVQIDSAQDLTKRVQFYKEFVAMGLKIPASQARAEFAFRTPLEADELLTAPVKSTAAGGPGGPPSQERTAKTAQKQTERSRNNPSRASVQPAPERKR